MLELEPLARERPELEPVLDRWTLRGVVGFTGCVSAGLDEELPGQPGLDDAVIAALMRIRERLPRDGNVEVGSANLARRADRVCEGHDWSTPGASPAWAGNVADAPRDLVAGRLPKHAGFFWFADRGRAAPAAQAGFGRVSRLVPDMTTPPGAAAHEGVPWSVRRSPHGERRNMAPAER